MQFCVDEYKRLNTNSDDKRSIIIHVTVATDIKLMKKLIAGVQ